MSEAWVSQANPKNKVVDPIPGMIVAINMYLQAYHMYRAAALNKPEVKSLDTMSRDALDTLQKEFPFGVRRADGTLRLYWCTEKPHSMVHWASNYRTVGRCRTISTNVTERPPILRKHASGQARGSSANCSMRTDAYHAYHAYQNRRGTQSTKTAMRTSCVPAAYHCVPLSTKNLVRSWYAVGTHAYQLRTNCVPDFWYSVVRNGTQLVRSWYAWQF